MPDSSSSLPLLNSGERHGHDSPAGGHPSLKGAFASSLGALSLVFLGLFCWLVHYPKQTSDALVNQYYLFYIHVVIMLYVGFGFLMTFLRRAPPIPVQYLVGLVCRRYSYSALALNMLVSALVTVEAVLVVGAGQQIFSGPKQGFITLTFPLLIDALFCAAAALITFGAVLGKATPAQLLWLVVVESVVYAGNAVVLGVVGIADIGGSVTIHAFGAYFGLAASLFLSPPGSGSSHKKNGAAYSTDMTAMIGTIFLYIFWPSFNAALGSAPGAVYQFQMVVIFNTVLSLIGATLSSFCLSVLFTGKLDMVHIQNATLAGGVAVGSAANMLISPGGALGVGLAAGALSTAGYVWVSPALEAKLGLRDTCGVHNLHGMPGVLGGLVAALAAGLAPNSAHLGLPHSGWTLAYFQVAGLAGNVLVALAAGALSGFVISKAVDPKPPVADMFEDEHLWHECEE